ncbi:hypothetical protein GGQ84_001048 [Desulfitispora alkaliphila]|uniref:HK97 gp10 family phage protein n=1 Tax=Desulfitispora alkaliphila TaxID=622674 RepID=UPI003D1E3BC2
MSRKGLTVDQAIREMQNRRKKAVDEVTVMIEADAKLNSPVDTGDLRRSLTSQTNHTQTKSIGAVGTNLIYAPIVEYRTGFLEQTVDQNLSQIQRRIGEVLRNG